jgi:hypothetical protein
MARPVLLLSGTPIKVEPFDEAELQLNGKTSKQRAPVRISTKRLSIALAITFLAGGLLSQKAQAIPIGPVGELELINGSTIVSVALTSGVANFNGVVGAYSINVTTGITYPAEGTLANPILELNSVDLYSGSGNSTLTILFSANGFGPTSSTFLSQIGGTVNNTPGSSLTYTAFDDPGGTLFAETHSLSSQGPYGPGAFSGTASSSLSLASYSLTQQVVITSASAHSSSFDATLTSLPDGGWTVALLGISLAGVEFMRRKMASRSRLTPLPA